MFTDQYIRYAHVRRVIDGDTIEVMVDNGYRRFSVERIRVSRINAPEIEGPSREQGLKSKAFVEFVLKPGDAIVIQSSKGDSFGRWIGEIWYTDVEGKQVNLSDMMLSNGLAVPFTK